MIVLYILLGIVAVSLIYIFCLYNALVKAKNNNEEAFATMDVYLKKRWDLVPNLVETVKGFAKHEKETFKEIVDLRSNSYGSMTTNEKIEANNKLSQNLTKLLAVAENYPTLQTNTNFQELNNQLAIIEDEIANSRKYYNATAKVLNNNRSAKGKLKKGD